MTSPAYCAPCISDLALVREAVTSVAGTASCMAHAVLLTHTTDDPGRRRHRLDALKDLAASKAETAEPTEQVKLELLVQEYGLAGAMDMGAPSRGRGPQQQRPGGGAPSASGEGRKSRRGRPRPDRPERPGQPGPRGEHRPEDGETVPVTPAPGPAGDGAPVEAVTALVAASSAPAESASAPAASSSAPASSSSAPTDSSAAPEQVTPAAPQPAPVSAPQAEPAAAPPSAAAAVPPTSDPDA